MYLQRQKKVFGLDFNDLINFTFYLFGKHEDVLHKWQEQLHYIQVDEFQDSSDRELRLLDMLSDIHKNLFVVGDPDQNIYEWRGSRMEILVNFDKTHDGTKTIIIDQNYRSTPQILAVANSLIDKNTTRIKKNLFTQNQNGAQVIHLHAKDERSEAAWMVSEIEDAVKHGKRKYQDFAMLYRAGFLSRYLEQALLEEDIPYLMWGSSRFYDRMEIRDTIATEANTTAFIDDERESAENTGVKQHELTYDPTESNLWKRADVPHVGWSFVNLIDLGTPSGVCEMCGHQIIRYVHIMTHPDYPGSIGAGSVCAGRMEGNYDKAEKRERDFKNIQNRRKNFIKRKWKKSRKGNLYITLMGEVIILFPDGFRDGYWRYSIQNEVSESFPSLEQAKLAAFDTVVEGKYNQ